MPTLPDPLDALVDDVQQAYPALWFACHLEHRTRGAPHETGLTDREATILAHIPVDGIDPAVLAGHLGLAKSSLSPHVARLEGLQLVESAAVPGDRRRKRLCLTPRGREVKRAASPLDATRLSAVLSTIPEGERQAAVAGLRRLAAAARQVLADDVHEGGSTHGGGEGR